MHKMDGGRVIASHNWISIWFWTTSLDSSCGKKLKFTQHWQMVELRRQKSRQITIVNILLLEIDIISGIGWLHLCLLQSTIDVKLNYDSKE